MKTLDTIYINGEFVAPHAIAAAKAVYPAFSRTTREQRKHWLERLSELVAGAEQDLVDVMAVEYGGTMAMAQDTARRAAASFAIACRVLPAAHQSSSRANSARRRPRCSRAYCMKPRCRHAFSISSPDAATLSAPRSSVTRISPGYLSPDRLRLAKRSRAVRSTR